MYINVTIGELQLSRSICDSLLSPRYSVSAASTAPPVWGGSDKIFPCIVTFRKHQEPASTERAELYYDCIIISAANRLIGEVVQSRRRPLLGPSPG